MTLKVAIVSRDAAVRAAAAKAFSEAPGEWSVELFEADPGNADVVVQGVDVVSGGGIVFDPARPRDALDAVSTMQPGARTYLVVGAAGGVGTTTVALHLAGMLGACCAEITAASRRLGLPEDARTWLPSGDDLAAAALPVAGGLRVLRAPTPCPGPGAFPLEAARATFPRLVLDAGARRDGVLHVDAAVLVTTPTRPAALAARSLMEQFPDVRWAVVVNRLGPGGQIMQGALEGLLARAIAVELPCCPALRDAEDEGRLLRGRWRRWTRGLARLAGALERC